MFLFVILCQYDEGWALIAKSLEKRTKQKSVMKDVLQTFECLLCFDAWFHLSQHWNLDNSHEAISAAQCSIKQLMCMIKKSTPHATGNGWKLAKMHELLHLLDNMTCFGAATNFTAESPENFLKTTVKKVGKKCQKQKAGTMFEQQAA